MESALQELLDQHKQYFTVQENGKVKCEINGHCLPPRLDAVSSFIKGAKFQKLKKRYDAENALSKYEPFIIKSKNFPTMLYCTLTVQLIDQSVEAVKKHMQGKKFIRAQERFLSDQQGLKPEPSLSEFEPSLRGPGEEESEEGPEFWVPAGEEDDMDSDGVEEEQQQQQQEEGEEGGSKAAAAGKRKSRGRKDSDGDVEMADAAAADAAADGAAGDDSDEDFFGGEDLAVQQQQQKQQKQQKAGKKGQGKKAQQQQQQQHGTQKHGANGGNGSRKRNAGRHGPSKKQKRS